MAVSIIPGEYEQFTRHTCTVHVCTRVGSVAVCLAIGPLFMYHPNAVKGATAFIWMQFAAVSPAVTQFYNVKSTKRFWRRYKHTQAWRKR